uniref:FMP27/BLTP2/Hobbit GFWDK motif-containing RBG unit domain-containing protein n=1 Tax=Oryza rufipogon TaxID=4529 RepID=A0A0E0NV49_ORYRU
MMVVGLVQLLVAFVVAWEAVELVLRHGLLLSLFKFALAAALAVAASFVAALFLARVVAWVLRRTAKLSIGCRSFSFNYLRDITIKSPKGAVDSICVGEIRLGLRRPLTQLGFTILNHGPILQLQISDLDIVLRQPAKSAKKKKPPPRKSTSTSPAKGKGKPKGQGKWRLITNIASLLSLSIVELRFKAPKAALGIKDLKIDLSKTGGLDPILNVEIHILPLFVQALEPDGIDNSTSVFSKLDWWVSGQYCSAMDTADCSSFLFEDIVLLCDLHQRGKGVGVKNLDLVIGPIVVNLEEKLFTKKKLSAPTVAEKTDEPAADVKSDTKSEGSKLSSLNKKIDLLPEKVSFNMSKLDLKFLPKDHGLLINNEIGGISVRFVKSQPHSDFGEATHLQLETDVSDIHLLMDGATSVLEVVKVATVVSANIPIQSTSPIRAEAGIKISGSQCNIIISRIKPLIPLNSAHKKPTVPRESSTQEKTPKEKLALDLVFTLSAPELTIVLYSLDDIPLYHVELGRSRLTHKEDLLDDKPVEEVTLFDVQKVKFVRRSGGSNDSAVCALINVTEVAVWWEPDPYLELLEVATRLKSIMHRIKHQNSANEIKDDTVYTDTLAKKDSLTEHDQQEKPQKKQELVIAVDVESLKISGELADGVEAMIHVGSIFSENAKIGVLIEGLVVSFCGARIFKCSRTQLSRIPVSISDSLPDKKLQSAATCDWVIQCRNAYVCLPFRLQLRAIDDAVEDTLRAIKLISAAKMSVLFPEKKSSGSSSSSSSSSSSKKSKSKSTEFRYVRVIVRDLVAEIEEEPIQGWLDEHIDLMKSVFNESTVRLDLLDELASVKHKDSPKAKLDGSSSEKNNGCPEVDGDAPGVCSFEKLREDIYKQAFQSYYLACQALKVSEGSGACSSGFQSGFKMSTRRSSVMSVCAKDVDVSLSKIDGGDEGMIGFIKTMDPVCAKNDIPFSRLYGSNFTLKAKSLSAYLRDYTFPLFSGTSAKCNGRLVLAQQATCFQPQVRQDVYVGKWWRVNLLRSATGYTPPMKSYVDLPLHFQKGEVSFGVGYEPVFADVSYAFTCALRRANLAKRWFFERPEPPRRERSLPWWDDMRNYIHGKFRLDFTKTTWHLPAKTSPYEKLDQMLITSDYLEICYVDGYVSLYSKYLKVYLTSLESLAKKCSLETPHHEVIPFLETPSFFMDIAIQWGCDSGNPMDHYIFALPAEGKPRDKVLDPFRSTSLSLKWSFSLKPSTTEPVKHQQNIQAVSNNSPTVNVGAHDFVWLMKWVNIFFLPPHKLRLFSRFPRFGVPRFIRSGNLPLDRVMTEQFIRFDASLLQINNMPLQVDDPANGLTLHFTKFRLEIAFSRGKQIFTFECKREPLDLVYQGIDLHLLKVSIKKTPEPSISKDAQVENKSLHMKATDSPGKNKTSSTEKSRDDGFFLYSDYFTIRKQTPKADAARLSAWQEDGRKKSEMPLAKSEFDGGEESDHAQSGSDEEGFNVVVADSCQRVFVYGLKILWNLENRAAIVSWVGDLTQAFQPPKPSPSRQYTQRKILEKKQSTKEAEMSNDGTLSSSPLASQSSDPPKQTKSSEPPSSGPSKLESTSTSDTAMKTSNSSDSEEEGTRHFMVNVVQPQFNLHSEEANGRFLLAAGSGRVLVRSFHSIVHVGQEMFEKALGSSNVAIGETRPEMSWSRYEVSVMLEHVQAHVAPTDVDPGAGIQWLPKIHRRSSEVKRTGALLERVFMPCQMYFRYTRHKGGNPELKVKPLKELAFNSPDITAGMTSRQFQVMMDVLTNLLFARAPRTKKSNLSYPLDNDDDDDTGEESDAVVPDGVEEVELAKIDVEIKEREWKILLDDIRTLSVGSEISADETQTPKSDDATWIVTGSRASLVKCLKKELVNVRNGRKEASSMLRVAMHKAAQARLMEKEKNKSPSFAMRVSLKINKVVWSMLADGKSFAEAEINDMIYDFDRDYKDIGIAHLTTKLFVLKNGLANAKSDTVLAPWNPPSEWGKNAMLRVNARQGAPTGGNSVIESLLVDIYPLKIYLTEAMYRMMWGYFFPGDEQHPQKRQELFKVSTTAGTRRVKKSTSIAETNSPSKQSSKDSMLLQKPELRRTSSFDRTWEETVAESVANELVTQFQSQSNAPPESQDAPKEAKLVRSARSTREEKKNMDPNEVKQTRPQKMMDFRNINISQVELQLTYEGLPFAVSDVRLLMDTFHREDFTGTWARLFSRGKKFKAKSTSQKEPTASLIAASDFNLSDSDGDEAGGSDQLPAFLKKPNDGAGDGFATSVKGLFSSQRKKAKAFVLKTMKGDADHDFQGERSENEIEFSPFARQLTITKTKKLIRRHTKKIKSKVPKGAATSQELGSELPPRGPSGNQTDSSSSDDNDSSPTETNPKD